MRDDLKIGNQTKKIKVHAYIYIPRVKMEIQWFSFKKIIKPMLFFKETRSIFVWWLIKLMCMMIIKFSWVRIIILHFLVQINHKSLKLQFVNNNVIYIRFFFSFEPRKINYFKVKLFSFLEILPDDYQYWKID